MTLHQLAKGESGIIYSLKQNEFQLKLVEMGFYKGRTVKVMMTDTSKHTLCVTVSDSKILLRREEASSIFVQKCVINLP